MTADGTRRIPFFVPTGKRLRARSQRPYTRDEFGNYDLNPLLERAIENGEACERCLELIEDCECEAPNE